MFVKSHIGNIIHCSILDSAKMKEYLKTIEEQFKTFDKVLASTLITKMCSMKFNDTKKVREHIMQMRDIVVQLKSLKIEMLRGFGWWAKVI